MRNLRNSGNGHRQQQSQQEEIQEKMKKIDPASIDPNMAEKVQQVMNQYGGKSQDELLQELKGAVQNGQMDNATLDRYYSMLSPMMNAQQKKRLEMIMRQLKS